MATAENLEAEGRRVYRHVTLGLASGAHDVALAAARSGASIESVVPEYVGAALRSGRSEELRDELDRFGINPMAAGYSAGTGEPLRPAERRTSSTQDTEGEAAERLASQIHGRAEPRATGDLGDKVWAVIKEQGGL